MRRQCAFPRSAERMRTIRATLEMTQVEFAYYLRVGIGTVSRWENGHVEPGNLAQQVINTLCVEHGIDMRNMRRFA